MDHPTTIQYTQKFNLQRRNLEPLFEPILVSHKKEMIASPTYMHSRQFRDFSVPRRRVSPYADTDFTSMKSPQDIMISRKNSAFIIGGDDLFQVELTKPPSKFKRPRRLSPIDDTRLKNEYLEENFTRLFDAVSK